MADIKHYKEEKERYRKFYMDMIDRGVINDPFDDISYDEYLFDEFYQTLCGGECSNDDSGLHLQRVNNLAKLAEFVRQQKDLPPEINDIVNDNFWDLI